MTSSGYSGELPPARFNMAAYCLAPGAPRVPGKVALTIVGRPDGAPECWTFAELDEAVRAVAAGLAGLGLVRGDRVMIRMGNTSDAALIFFGAIAGGFVPVPSSAMLTEHEAQFVLADCGARVVALSPELDFETPANVVRLNPAAIAKLRGTPPSGYADTGAEDPAFLVYTSGTSGKPKGVLHAHRSAWGRRPMYRGWYGITADDVLVHAGAVNWTYTLGVGLTDPWANGASTVLYNGPKDAGVWPRLIRQHGGTLFAAVPSLYRQILRDSDIATAGVPTLRHGLTAGEPLPVPLAEAWRETTGLSLYEALGMSECSTYVSSGPETPVKPGSPGRPQPGRCIAILPVEDGAAPEPLPPGETGLLAIHRSDPGLMLGYWNRPDEDEAVMRGDWFCGGDLAEMDPDGYVWFHGRADDVMNAQGYRVSPAEVEAVLRAHPDVHEVAVAEVEAHNGVHIIAAFVVPEGEARDGSAILAHAEKDLARYKCPREVVFVESLPHSANGKLLRRELPRSL